MPLDKKISIEKLSEIVLDMMGQNVSENEIVTYLQQTGLTLKESQDILAKSKDFFEKSLNERLDNVVDKKVGEKATQKFEQMKKDFELKQDFKLMEQKNYTDKKVNEKMQEINSVKSELVSLKLKEEAELKRMQDKIDLLKMSGSTQKYLGSGLLMGGVFALIAVLYFSFVVLSNYILQSKPIDFYLVIYIMFILILGIAASASLNIGYKIFSTAERKLEQVGLEIINKKKKEEDGSIQELMKDEDVV